MYTRFAGERNSQYELPNASAAIDMHRADQPVRVTSDATHVPLHCRRNTLPPGKSPGM